MAGLGTALENVLDSEPSRAVLLFEYRNLPGLTSKDMKSFVINAENAFIAYHKTGGNAPRFVRRRADGKYANIKRRECHHIPPAYVVPVTPKPTTVPAATDSYDVSYKFAFDSFEVRGKKFDAAKLGDNRSGLETQIKGCGAVTNQVEVRDDIQ